MTLNYGAIHIERGTGNAMNFYGYWELDIDFDVQITNFPGDSRLPLYLQSIKRTVYVVDATFKTTADAEAFISGTTSLMASGAFTLELQVEAADYFEMDGTNTSMEVMCLNIKKLQPVGQGYGTPKVYTIPFIIFQEAG